MSNKTFSLTPSYFEFMFYFILLLFESINFYEFFKFDLSDISLNFAFFLRSTFLPRVSLKSLFSFIITFFEIKSFELFVGFCF